MKASKPSRNFINDIPITYKFLIIYICCILIPIIAINLFFYGQNSKQIRLREESNFHMTMERVSKEIKAIIDESIIVSHSIEGDRLLAEALDRTYVDDIDYYDAYVALLRDRLSRNVLVNPSFVAAEIYLDNPSFQNGGNYFIYEYRTGKWFDQLPEDLSRFYLFAHVDQKRSGGGLEKKLSIVKELRQYADLSQYRKLLRIDLNLEKVNSILQRESENQQLLLVDHKNQVIATGSGTGQKDAFSLLDVEKDGSVQYALGGEEYVKGWKLIGVGNDTRMEALLDEARRSIIWLAIISTLLPSLLILIILRSYNFRIKKLVRHMQKVRHEKFDLIQMNEGADEIGGLIRTYNLMAERIHALINDVYKLEIKQKNLEIERIRAEMNMLHSQMNPHFLFNVMNALLVVSTTQGYTQVSDVIKNLSLMLRRLLRWTEDVVQLKDELEFTRMYLELEKFRFGDRMEYVFNIEDDAALCYVPRMSVQPLVENACKHGLQMTRRKGNITISAKLSGNELVVTVDDNGAGIEEDMLVKIRQAVYSTEDMKGHVGIRNVYRRLELYCEKRVVMELSSKQGAGTTIGYRIPYPLNKESGD